MWEGASSCSPTIRRSGGTKGSAMGRSGCGVLAQLKVVIWTEIPSGRKDLVELMSKSSSMEDPLVSMKKCSGSPALGGIALCRTAVYSSPRNFELPVPREKREFIHNEFDKWIKERSEAWLFVDVKFM